MDSPPFAFSASFQLTSSRRGWRLCNSWFGCRRGISTHILTKRMTPATKMPCTIAVFQLTSSRRGWQLALQNFHFIRIFQLTSSRRGWQYKETLQACLQGISTHILTKRMTCKEKTERSEELFQLTSSRRGWRLEQECSCHCQQFQLTSSRRGWLWFQKHTTAKQTFQLTSSRRGWRCNFPLRAVPLWYFNSHPHEEDDQLRDYFSCSQTHFNSHPHEEDDEYTAKIMSMFLTFQLTSSRRGWP